VQRPLAAFADIAIDMALPRGLAPLAGCRNGCPCGSGLRIT
jgi:hypothetical protein